MLLSNDITFGPWLEQEKGIIKGNSSPAVFFFNFENWIFFSYFASAYYGAIGSDGSYITIEIL